ncbi:DNA-binding response OmpR family regulator [Rhizobium sp. BE258]|jgi:DNA-binding response OmpR family regulator|nr:DNA-binding response OmpR family regulator [Rhizobium sp. BE258]
MRILIVEDEFLIAMDIEEAVRALGYDVVGPVGSLQEAMELAGEADVALVDVRLKDGVTGPEVGNHLHFQYGVTVVFITGNPEAVRQNKAAIGVLQKPFRLAEIESVVKFAVGRRQGGNPAVPTRLELLEAA